MEVEVSSSFMLEVKADTGSDSSSMLEVDTDITSRGRCCCITERVDKKTVCTLKIANLGGLTQALAEGESKLVKSHPCYLLSSSTTLACEKEIVLTRKAFLP